MKMIIKNNGFEIKFELGNQGFNII